MNLIARRLSRLELSSGSDLSRLTDRELEARIVAAARGSGFDAELALAIPHLSDAGLEALLSQAKGASILEQRA